MFLLTWKLATPTNFALRNAAYDQIPDALNPTNAAYDKMSAVLSEEALAEREHARQGHGGLEGVNGTADTAVSVLPAHVDVSFKNDVSFKDGTPAAEPGAASPTAQASF